jgi:hypothetical protein
MLRRILFLFAFLLAIPPAAFADEPVSVMVLGMFHWSNPNRDLHNVQVDDVLAPKRQAEIAAIAQGLSRFNPTKVAVEWHDADASARYAQFLNGALPQSRNEVVQLGFRLAKANNASLHGIDVDGDFPYDAVADYAKTHGQQNVLAEADGLIVRQVKKEQSLIDSGTMSDLLRWLNDPANEDGENAFNRALMKVGGGNEQPGAELFAAWAKRNALICANLLQLAKPGDRIVAIFGSGHQTFLRQCVRETPGFRLVEANNYLPR